MQDESEQKPPEQGPTKKKGKVRLMVGDKVEDDPERFWKLVEEGLSEAPGTFPFK